MYVYIFIFHICNNIQFAIVTDSCVISRGWEKEKCISNEVIERKSHYYYFFGPGKLCSFLYYTFFNSYIPRAYSN